MAAAKRKKDDADENGQCNVKKFKPLPLSLPPAQKFVQELANKEIFGDKCWISSFYINFVSELQEKDLVNTDYNFNWLLSETCNKMAIYVGETTTLLGILCYRRWTKQDSNYFFDKQTLRLFETFKVTKPVSTILRTMVNAPVFYEELITPVTPLGLCLYRINTHSTRLVECFLDSSFQCDLDLEFTFVNDEAEVVGPLFCSLPWFFATRNTKKTISDVLSMLITHELEHRLDFSRVCIFPRKVFVWSQTSDTEPSEKTSASLFQVWQHTFHTGLEKNYSQTILNRHLIYMNQAVSILKTFPLLLDSLLNIVLDYFCHDSILEKLVS